MTFDEEVYEYAKSRNGTEDSRMTDRMLAYRAGAKSKEKRIEELEKSNENLANQSMILLNGQVKLESQINDLKLQIQKMKCCENCKHHSFCGDELKCNLMSYDDEFGCLKTKSKWELSD